MERRWFQKEMWYGGKPVRVFFVIFFTLAVIQTLRSQENQKIPVRLTDCVRSALEGNAILKASRARVDAAAGKAGELRSALFPQIRFSGRVAYLSEVPEFTIPFLGPKPLFPSITRNYAARLTLQQNLFSGFRIMKGIEAAEHQQTAANYEYSKDQADLMMNVVMAYWNLYRAQKLEQVLAQSVDQVTAHVRDVENFKKQGMATDLDLLKVRTQLSDITVKHIEAQGNVRLAAMGLNSLTGTPLQTLVVPADSPRVEDSVPEAEMTVEDVIKQAREKRFEISAVSARRETAEASIAAARAGWYPQIALSANYDYARPNPRIIPPKDAWEKSWDVGLTMQWSIWDWFATSNQTSQAQANLSQAEAAVRQVSDAVALEAARNYFQMKEVRERVTAAAFGLKQAEEGYRVALEKFKRGLASNTDLLDSELALLQARLNETRGVVDYVIQVQQLKKSIGASL